MSDDNLIDLNATEMDIAEEIQQECHMAIEFIMKKKPECSYQEATDVWLFTRLAKMEYRMRKLKHAIQDISPKSDEIF
jgi:hypothetical protein